MTGPRRRESSPPCPRRYRAPSTGVLHRASVTGQPGPRVTQGLNHRPAPEASRHRPTGIDRPRTRVRTPQRQLSPLLHTVPGQHLRLHPHRLARAARDHQALTEEVLEGDAVRVGQSEATARRPHRLVQGESRDISYVNRLNTLLTRCRRHHPPPRWARDSHHGSRPTYSPGPSRTPGRRNTAASPKASWTARSPPAF